MSGGGGEGRSRGGRLDSFLVDGAAAGQRLDAFLGHALGISATAARRLIAEGLVRLGDRRGSKGARLTEGTRVHVAVHPDPELPLIAEDAADLVVVHEDPHVIAIDKPAGMASHPLRAGERGTAANLIAARFPECAAASPDPREGGLVHRLDTGTSGVLLAARSRAAWTALRAVLGGGDCEKTYLCEVGGHPPEDGHVDSEIGRQGRRGRVVRVGGGRHPQPAATDWRVLARGAGTSLVEARLHAGRAHQVRAHLAAAGFPIVGDDRYGEAAAVKAQPDEQGSGLRLHALSVSFRHPLTGAHVVVRAPPPAWARRFS